jgi:hypothetical protein
MILQIRHLSFAVCGEKYFWDLSYAQRDYTVRGKSNVWRLPKYWPPHRHHPASVYPPAVGAGGGHTRWVEREWGVNSSEDARHCSVLYICKYFVSLPNLKQGRVLIFVLDSILGSYSILGIDFSPINSFKKFASEGERHRNQAHICLF